MRCLFIYETISIPSNMLLYLPINIELGCEKNSSAFSASGLFVTRVTVIKYWCYSKDTFTIVGRKDWVIN